MVGMEASLGARMRVHMVGRTGPRRRAALVPGACRAWCAISVALACLAVGAEPSFAGTYVMRNCDVPGHAPAPIGPWRPVPAPTTVLVDNCSVGGGFDFTLPWARTMGQLTNASLNIDPPTDEPRRAIGLVRLRIWTKTLLTGTGQPLSARGEVYGTGVVGGFEMESDGSSAKAAVDLDLPPPPLAVRVILHCAAGNDRPARAASVQPDCYADADVPLEVRGTELTLREDVAPAGSAASGSLLGNEPVSAVRTLDYSVSDAESGVARVEAVLGDTVVAARDLTGRCSFADWSVCPTADRDTLSVDTRSVPNGRHTLTLRVIDAAGNRHDAQIQSVEVRNQESPAAVPIGIAAAPPPQLTARFANSPRSSLIVPWGRRLTIRGRLVGPAQNGLPGARIDVFERAAKADAAETAVGTARTRPDGTFSYPLASKRPSRTVRIAYGPTVAPLLRVRVRAASTLTASLRGLTVRFSGRVLSRPLPPAGKRVILEGIAPGYAWARFAMIRTDRLGRFHGRYRLQARRPGVRLQLRALVPNERGYPYLQSTGRPVTLRVP
jgi:hypothetical protein